MVGAAPVWVGPCPSPYCSCPGLRGSGRTPAEGTLGGSGVCPARVGRGSASAGATGIGAPGEGDSLSPLRLGRVRGLLLPLLGWGGSQSE